MTYKGTICCKRCGEALAQARNVLEREKSWCERQAFYNCRPHCEHVREAVSYKSHGFYFDVEVHWESEEEAA